ncbi:MAG: hypothetical protein A2Y41_02635 [Spirochaetes bacterium GWB1_36_13]|nr:MAG: hypothetical protein A2Y41_02635 [Spirochaetes bacterium GWB1_36_13]
MEQIKNSEFKFLGYRISKIECIIEDNFGVMSEKINHKINIINNFDSKNSRFVEVVLDISVKTESNSFNFFLQIKGGFEGNSEMDDILFKKLSQQNAPAILFPFARSIITSYTAQANIPPIILPALNFSQSN